MKRIWVKEEVCIGCRLCEIHCLVQHSRTKKIIKAFKEEYPRPLSRVLVEERGPLSFALQCRHCDDAPCVSACITGAMQRDEKTGAIINDPDRCIGCWTCIMVCPYGAILRDEEGKKIASKCDLCPDEEIPVCVLNCPNEALTYEEI
ncbi:MAG: 4Fe-4S ferredoxin [Armatimonadetes bacterium CG07_land_8_20_14_0_80_40_9]|nr:MAG: 4Fe-4S ferredoxin [Armatimonadetes bacterium CG07_land_8_20_14_0_80_40_9]